MKSRLLLLTLRFAAVARCLFAALANTQMRETTNAATPETGVVLTKLFPPAYPPLARQARIMGDVKLQVGIRQDGSVASGDVVSGHPMLKQAALDSAQKSQFECRQCGDPVTAYSMTYTFGFYDDGGCGRSRRVRSSKCLYLWKCGEEWQGPENWPEYSAPKVTQSQGHVTILVSSVCVQTETETAR
jgi:TonB family protein